MTEAVNKTKGAAGNSAPTESKEHKAKDRDGIYKRRGYWHYALVIDGRRRSFSTETKDYNEAKKKRAEAFRQLAQGRISEDSGRKHFEPAAAAYIEHRVATMAEGTVRIEKERLKPLKRVLGNVRLKDISARTIRDYQATRAGEVSNCTVNLEVKLLRAILKAEGQWKRLAEDVKSLPATGTGPGRALTPEESLRLFTAAQSNEDWLVAYLAATVANDTGMRGVELRNLKLADVDAEARKITIRRTKGNNGLFRTVVLTNDALKAVLKLLDRAQKLNSYEPDHYVFPYKIRKGVGYDPSRPAKGWRTAWRKLREAAGLGSGQDGFRFHDLRHTFITAHAEAGTPLPVVQAQAGHLSKKMTELYTHISQRALEEAAQRFEQRKAQMLSEAKKKNEDGQARRGAVVVN